VIDLDADIDSMLGGIDPVTVVFGAHTGVGTCDIVDKDMLETVTSAIGEIRNVLVRTTAFPGIAVGVLVTVDGTPFRVIDRKRLDDGRITLLALGVSA
jgi:hypothetical protein